MNVNWSLLGESRRVKRKQDYFVTLLIHTSRALYPEQRPAFSVTPEQPFPVPVGSAGDWYPLTQPFGNFCSKIRQSSLLRPLFAICFDIPVEECISYLLLFVLTRLFPMVIQVALDKRASMCYRSKCIFSLPNFISHFCLGLGWRFVCLSSTISIFIVTSLLHWNKGKMTISTGAC